MDARWDLRLLGHPALHGGDGRLVDLPKKAFAIAARLMLDRPNHQCSRSDLAEFLWSDADAAHQRTNLRTLLKRVRAGVGGPTASPFSIDGEIIALDPGAMRCDLTEFKRLLATGDASDVVEAAALFSGELIEKCDNGPTAYEHWLRNQRAALSQMFRASACRALESADLDLLPTKKEALARRLIEENPNDEAGHRALLRVYASQGDFERVRSTYDRLARSLKAELGCLPSDETRALYRSLTTRGESAAEETFSPARGYQANTSFATPMLGAESRAPVLLVPSALASDSGPPLHECAQIVDDLIIQLWKRRSLRIAVLGRDDAPVAAGQNLNDSDVYRLHFGVRSAQAVRFSARLVHEPASDLLWAESFLLTSDRYEQVVARVADAIIGKIEDHQIEAENLRPEKLRTSFALVAQAERALLNVDLPSVRRARRLLRAAAQTSADVSRAHARLARTYWMEWMLRAGQDTALLTTARTIARSALEMQPDSHIVHQELGMTALYQGQYQLALEHLSRARELNPFDGQVLVDFADALIANGQAREALALVKTGKVTNYRLADFHNWVSATGHYVLGEYNAAAAKLLEMKHPAPTFRLLAACYAMLGEHEKATEFKAKYLEENPNFLTDEWLLQCPMSGEDDVKHLREGSLLAGFK
jgi:DNA-binding SARP family transcriptional activator/Flp pilus assembly protein TadD